MDDPKKRLMASSLAQVAESCRLAGDYSGAIQKFDQVIEASPGFHWAYAHRGAARAALGNFKGAKADLDKAEELCADYTWARAQRGELYRLWAQDALGHGHMGPDRIEEVTGLLNQSISSFERLLDSKHVSPWLYAHLGAAYTTRYWLTQRDRGEADYEAAIKNFTAATTLNPAYGWAYLFKAVAASLHGDKTEAIQLVGQAQAAGLNRQQATLQSLMEMTLYSARGQENQVARDAAYAKAVQLGWQLLQVDAEQTGARYVVAAGLAHLRDDEAPSAINVARNSIRVAKERLVAMEASLMLLELVSGSPADGPPLFLDEGKVEIAEHLKKLLEAITHTGDIHTIMMLRNDPAWEMVKGWPTVKRIIDRFF